MICLNEHHVPDGGGHNDLLHRSRCEDRKACLACGRVLMLTSFYRNHHCKFGRDSICKDCRRNLRSAWVDGDMYEPAVKAR